MGLGDHPETFLLKALCCQSAPSWVKVGGWVVGGGWVVAHEILLSALGLGVVSILYFLFYSQVPGPRSQSQSLDNWKFGPETPD